MLAQNKELPISPMKKLKILSENQNVHNKENEYVTKYDVNNDLKIKMNNLKPQEQIEEIEHEKEIEPLLQETPDQYVIFPINHHDIWHMYKELVGHFWSTTDNLENLEPLYLEEKEKEFLKIVYSFYSTLDSNCGIVNENFAEEFSKLVQITEAKFYYGHQLFIQNIHFEIYNKLFEKLVHNEDERNRLYTNIESDEATINKRKWIRTWSDKSVDFANKLVASACLHGLFFTTLDIIQLWFKNRSEVKFIKHELVEVTNKMIIDQNSHRDFACLMVSHLKNKPSDDFIKNLIDEATKLEKKFLYEAIPIKFIDLTEKNIDEILDKKSTALKLKLLKANDTTSTIKPVASEKQLFVDENKPNVQKEDCKKFILDEDF